MDTTDLVRHCDLSWHINAALLKRIQRLDYNVRSVPFITEVNGAGVKIQPAISFELGYHRTKIRADDGFMPKIVNEKKLSVVQNTTLGRLIKKCVPETVKDDKIRSLVEEFKTMVDPKFFDKYVVLPKTVEQYYTMFDMQNGSCLQARSTYYGKATTDKWVQFYEQHRLHPGAWLLYNPNLQGVYMVDAKGNAIARCVVYLEDGVPVAADYPKGIGTNYYYLTDLLKQHLLKSPKKPNNLWKNLIPFKIDGFQLKDDPEVYFPWPTLDNPIVIDGLFCGYNPDTRQLHVAMDKDDESLKGLPVVPAGYRYDYHGFMKASTYANFKPADKVSQARAA